MWETINAPLEVDGITYPAMGPAPWIETYPPWQFDLSTLLCPSSIIDRLKQIQPTHYAFCIGDISTEIHAPHAPRGAFACRRYTRLSHISDGLGYTVALGEIASLHDRLASGQIAIQQPLALLSNPSLCLAQAANSKYLPNVTLSANGRGARWTDGAAPFALFATILPPQSPSCAVNGGEAVDGVYSSGSLHTGGAQVAMADGTIQFISADIDTGDVKRSPPTAAQFTSAPTPSPFGVWGALGTAASEDAAYSQ